MVVVATVTTTVSRAGKQAKMTSSKGPMQHASVLREAVEETKNTVLGKEEGMDVRSCSLVAALLACSLAS